MIEELVLRWPRELNRTLFLRPFEPSEQRIADGGPPLVQEWTKWVLGPGEEGRARRHRLARLGAADAGGDPDDPR